MKIVNSKTTVDLVDVPLEQLEAAKKVIGSLAIDTLGNLIEEKFITEEEANLQYKFFTQLSEALYGYNKHQE